MKYLFDHWEEIKEDLKSNELMFFLDFDGTLTPIVETPDKAILSTETKSLLSQLSKLTDCRVAIISGRSLTDIKQKIGVNNILYIGNHGLETKGLHVIVSAQTERVLQRIKMELKRKLANIQGIILEDKGLILSVHYRLLSEENIKIVEKVILSVCRDGLESKEIDIMGGKKVFEIRPAVEWDKGHAILWILSGYEFDEKEHILPICIGDDITDEDAFRAVRDRGLSIMIGEPKSSNAEYYLRDPDDVFRFLSRIYEIKRG